MPVTATGLFSAMTFASFIASLTTSDRPPSITLDTRPRNKASEGEKFRPVNASSRKKLSLEDIFGNRANVPMSDARPRSTSYFMK